METVYFLVIALVGGFITLFLAAGWGSFKDKKVPETGILFRWFLAGLVACGLGAYAWIFGSGGDVSQLTKTLVESLDIKTVQSAAETVVETVKEASEELTVGMPTF